MIDWFFATLKQYPEIAIFLTLAIGYYFGKFTFKGIGLGSVTATLLAGVLIGQIGITIAQPLKATVFLMFLFAVGYAVGPQFVRGVAKTACRRRSSRWSNACSACWFPSRSRRSPATTSAMPPDSIPGRRRSPPRWACRPTPSTGLGLAADQAKALIDSMPVAYAVSYMFGTMGSAVVIAVLGPKLLGINLVAACKDYEQKQRRRQGTRRTRHGLAALGSAGVPRGEGWKGRGPACERGRGAGARLARLRAAPPPQREDRRGGRRYRPAGRRRPGGRGRSRRAGQVAR